MTKKQSATAPEATTKAVSGKNRKKSPRPERVPKKAKLREELVAMILKSGKEIVKGVVGEAKKGNYLPAKYLLEFAGIAEPLAEMNADAMARVKSLAEILFDAVQNQKTSGEAEPTSTVAE